MIKVLMILSSPTRYCNRESVYETLYFDVEINEKKEKETKSRRREANSERESERNI